MATSAFKSRTRRTSIGGGPTNSDDYSVSSNNNNSATHRRSRSVSRFSHHIPTESALDYGETPARRDKFVNTVRGSGFPEISLDDLAIEMLSSSELSGRGRSSEQFRDGTASQRRGRSVLRRQRSGPGAGKIIGEGSRAVGSDASARRRRSLSVVRYQVFDSESDSHSELYTSHSKHKSFSSGNKQKPLVQKPIASSQQRGLRRCSSQKDLLKSHEDYSSYSSTLTEDQTRVCCSSDGIEKTIQAVYAQKKSEHPSDDDVNNNLYQTMRRELRHAVEEITLELKQARVSQNPSEFINDRCSRPRNFNGVQAVPTTRSYTTKLEQSERHKKELLAEILLEQRGKKLEKIVGKMLPDQRNTVTVKRPTRSRKRSNDRNRISKQLTNEAEKIIEDFISSVEDTDISSFDGERSETSSTFSITTKSRDGLMHFGETETFRSPGRDKQHLATPEVVPRDMLEEVCAAQDQSIHFKSSRGSWSPEVVDSFSIDLDEMSRSAELDSHKNHVLSGMPRKSRVDVVDYLKLPSSEDFLFEMWQNRKTIARGGLLLCHSSLGNVL